jgi:two-component system phosphate regulon sensor histidine kinase PhoR
MILSHRRLGLTVGLLSGALVGLMAVQGLLLRDAWLQKEQAFERNVRSALAQAVQQIEVGEIAGKANQMFFEVAAGDTAMAVMHQMRTDAADSIVVVYAQDTVWRPENEGAVTGNFTLTVEGDRTRLIKQVVGELVQLQPQPLAQRLATANVDSLLTAQLLAVGIDLKPRFAVLTAGGDSVAAFGPADPELGASPFRARLFPLDLTPPRYDLVLGFSHQDAFVLRQLAPLLVASLVLMTVIVVGFASTLKTLREQRRFARQVVDFVNNMTHEFKTPLSTVSLASEAIGRGPEPEAVARFNRMIREETDRMGRQVEKILQVARLEGGDFELARIPLDGNSLVDSACAAFALQVQERQGKLECRLSSEAAPLLGDPHHLESVLNNLLDNALKYSPQAPEIRVETAVEGQQLVITVADRGLGVRRSDLERVFEPYYRCPTGNRHDVKGHGLGLSTVRLLVEAHGGRVTMKENPGGGAMVRVRLPLSRQEEPA